MDNDVLRRLDAELTRRQRPGIPPLHWRVARPITLNDLAEVRENGEMPLHSYEVSEDMLHRYIEFLRSPSNAGMVTRGELTTFNGIPTELLDNLLRDLRDMRLPESEPLPIPQYQPFDTFAGMPVHRVAGGVIIQFNEYDRITVHNGETVGYGGHSITLSLDGQELTDERTYIQPDGNNVHTIDRYRTTNIPPLIPPDRPEEHTFIANNPVHIDFSVLERSMLSSVGEDGLTIDRREPARPVPLWGQHRKRPLFSERMGIINGKEKEKMSDALKLREILEAIEGTGKVIAFDLGEHFRCSIDSNCPRAIELRRILEQMGISWKELQPPPPEPDPFTLPNGTLRDINAKVTIGGAEIDMGNLIKEEAQYKIQHNLDNMRENQRRITNYGAGLYNTYQSMVRQARMNTKLPQLPYTLAELDRYNCTIGLCENKQYYEIGFRYQYAPKYLYSNGKRFQISELYAKQLERETRLIFWVTHQRKMLAPVLFLLDGKKLGHYHGHGTDCWGTAKMLEKWDGTIVQLYEQYRLLTGALATINLDSLMQHSPEGFPHIDDVKKHSKLLGDEGKATHGTVAGETARGWGRIPTGGISV